MPGRSWRSSLRPSGAWLAGLVALFALLRGLRRMHDPAEGPLVLGLALAVVVVTGLLPAASGRDRLPAAQLAVRKAVQFFAAAGVLLLAVYLGAGIVPAALLGLGAAALVPLLSPSARAGDRPAGQG